jgi:hypothetical protein
VKLFTVDEANAALPLVRRITTDLRESWHAWQEAVTRYELAAAGTRSDEGENERLVALRDQVQARAARVSRLLGELAAVGCELKDFDQGLVDFYALAEDRLVYLCWRLGEDRIAWWHEVDAGFAGRRPLEETLFPGVVP